MKKITLMIVLLLSFVVGFSQTTVTVGTGTAASGTNDNGNPIYRSAATSVFNYSQSVQLINSTDLSAVGLTAGSTITKIAYYKTSAFTMSSGRTADLKIYLKNSASTSLVTTQNMATWITGATLGYSNPAFSSADIPAAAGWVEFNLSTPFSYTGGAIEVSFDFIGDTTAAGLTDGAFLWQYTTSATTQAVGTSNSIPITTALSTAQSRLYNAQLTFTNSPCIGTPAPGNTLVSNATPCLGSNVTLSVQNATIGSGVTYQWYNSAGIITGATNPTYVQAVIAAESYYCEVTCSGNTTATTPVSVSPLIINTFPWLEPFATFLPNCWQLADNGDLIAGPATFGTSSWAADGFGNNGTTGSIRYEIWLAAANDWVISPMVNIPAAGYELKFDAAVTQYNTTAPPTTPWEADDFVEVLVSTGYTNWTVLYTYNDGNVPSTTGNANIIDLDAYAGQNVRFAFRVVEGSSNGAADLNFYVDNFQVRLTPTCPEPTLLTVNTITNNSANIGWTESGSSTVWEIQYGITGFTLGTGTIVAAPTNPMILPGLNSNTSYDVYVRAVCGTSDFSYWTGPSSFKTQCNDVTSFLETFDTYPSGTTSLPDCWSKLGTSANVYIQTGAAAPMSPANRLYMNLATTTTAYAILPSVSNLQADTHRLKFKAYCSTTGKTLSIGYFSTPGDVSTYVEIEPLILPGTNLASTQNFIITPTGIPAGVKQLVINIVQPTPAAVTVYIDDVAWELIPSVAPSCAQNLVATPNPTCGNFANLISWNPTAGADGYFITVGTTSGGNDIENNFNLGSLTSYSFSGNFNTPYYYTVVPYNAVGLATGCTEQTFTTFATGCYCTSLPTSNDASGITNVQLGTTSFPTTDVTYFNHSATTVNLSQGLNSNVQITFATGFTYNTYIWIDFNDNLTFEPSEIVFTGESLSANPTILNASFTVPPTAALGVHRMRIVTADSLTTPNPCYSGLFGVTLDFSVNIILSSCTPASGTATIVPDCANNQYSVSVDVTNLGSGSPVLSYGTTTLPITATGVVIVGPFASGTTNTLTLLHGSDTNCDIPLGIFTYSCPPVNDNCANATVLTVNPNYSCAVVTSGTVAAATDSGLTNSTCFGTEDDDVWYSFVATATSHRISLINVAGSTTDMYHVIYNGTGGCTALGASLLCSDSDVSNPTGLVIGNTYYIQVYTYTSTPNQTSTFNICVGTPPTCYEPTALSTVYVAPTSVNLSWVAPTLGNTPVGYNWEIVPQGNGQGNGVVASGNTVTTNAVATGLTASTLYDLYVQTNCGGTDQSSWVVITFITDYCLPSGTSALSYINNFSTTLGATNITNNSSGFSVANYGNFTSLSTSLGATQSFNFNVDIIGGTVGCAIWIDWGNDFVFNSSDMVYSTTSYGAGPFTGSITVPAATPSGNYRMRVMIDYLDSNPGDDSACGFASGRGEVEDYIVTVDNTLQSENFDNSNFVAYPNPVKDVLNLSYSSEITSFKVINLLGQEVISKKVNNTTSQIDMTSLTAGAYIVNVTVGDIVKTIKVIKE